MAPTAIKQAIIKKFLPLFICLLLLPAYSAEAQSASYSIGINTGISSFESLSMPVSGLNLSAYFEFPAWFTRAFNFQTAFFYIRKTEYFLPDNSDGKYYPYLYGVSFSGVMRQRIKKSFFAEEQAGIILLKDKFFSYSNSTNYGICFGIFGGIDLRNEYNPGFLLSLGYKGGLTFNGEKPSYNSFLLQAQYLF